MNESVIRCGNTKKRAKQSVNLKLRLQLLAKALQYDARGLQGAITAHTIFFFTMKMSIVCLLRHHFGDVDTVAHELLRRTSLHLQCSLHLLQNTHSFTQRRSVNFLNALVSAFPSDKKIIIYALFFVFQSGVEPSLEKFEQQDWDQP